MPTDEGSEGSNRLDSRMVTWSILRDETPFTESKVSRVKAHDARPIRMVAGRWHSDVKLEAE